MGRIRPMSSRDSMDHRDLDLLRRSKLGREHSSPAKGQRGETLRDRDAAQVTRRGIIRSCEQATLGERQLPPRMINGSGREAPASRG